MADQKNMLREMVTHIFSPAVQYGELKGEPYLNAYPNKLLV